MGLALSNTKKGNYNDLSINGTGTQKTKDYQNAILFCLVLLV